MGMSPCGGSSSMGKLISGVCGAWPVTIGKHRAISCLVLQWDNVGVILQGGINVSAGLLTCSAVTHLS